jgi:hypothetical protein
MTDGASEESVWSVRSFQDVPPTRHAGSLMNYGTGTGTKLRCFLFCVMCDGARVMDYQVPTVKSEIDSSIELHFP